jgi:hypothetical protein
MTGTSCVFIFTKLPDLPLHYYFFLHMYNYVIIDNLVEDRCHKASGYHEGFDSRYLRTYCKLRQVLIVTSTYGLCYKLKSFDACLHIKVYHESFIKMTYII